jgi:hypothetical protein
VCVLRVLRGLKQLTQIIVGPNSLMQSIVSTVLTRTDPSFYDGAGGGTHACQLSGVGGCVS